MGRKDRRCQNSLWRPEVRKNGDLLGVIRCQGSAGLWGLQEVRKKEMRKKKFAGNRGSEKGIK